MPKHPDFEKIYNQFTKRYGKERGEKFYYSWLSKMQLDDTKPYGTQKKESFAWAKPHIATWKESEPNFTYWKVEAAFPVSSMNRNVYTEAELKAAARTLVGKPLKQNHEVILTSDLAKIVDAEYEDGAVEVVIGIDNTQPTGQSLNKAIESGLLENPPDNAIVHVSLEADCKRGVEPHPEGKKCCGLVFTALSLLDKAVLPGIPLTKFYAAESFTGEFEGIMAESLATKTMPETVLTMLPTVSASAESFTPNISYEVYLGRDRDEEAKESQDTTPKPPPEAAKDAAPMKDAGATSSPGAEAPKAQAQEPAKAEAPKEPTKPVTPQADTLAPASAANSPGQGSSGQAGKQPQQAQAGDEGKDSKGLVSPTPANTPVQTSASASASAPTASAPVAPAMADPNLSPSLPETTDAILTQAGFWDRFNLYHDRYNISRQDSFRLVAMDMIRHAEKGKKK